MATKPVKWFHSGMAGAPTLNGAAGSLIAVLDACLVNGFNLQTLTSLAVSGGVLTGTKSGHGYVVDQVVVTSGANEATLNGEWTITEVTANTFKADATGVSDVTGSGTISVKAAPSGWTKQYSGTNKAAYKGAAGGTGCLLRVDDTGTLNARVVGYETMTDVDTGTGPFPTTAQLSGGGYWPKSSDTTTARNWLVVTDGMTFYLVRNHTSTYFSHDCFGDYASEKSGDMYCCMLQAHLSSTYAASQGYSQIGYYGFSSPSGSNMWSPRSYTQTGTSVQVSTAFFGPTTTVSGPLSGSLTYPSLANNGLIISQNALREVSAAVLRCSALPGVYSTPQNAPLVYLDKVTDVPGLSGRKLITTEANIAGGVGRLFFDITGPWR